MARDINLDSTALKIGWVSMEGGYEVTQSAGIIRKNMEYLKTGRIIINLICRGYQSGSTLLFDFDEQRLFIDKPKDWTADNNKFRVVFRNEAMVWMHFVTTVQEVGPDALKCSWPKELYMLQRRSHYRVLLPRDSRVSFLYNEEPCEFEVKDLSVGGFLMYSKFDSEIPQHGNYLQNLQLSVPCQDKIPGVENGFLTIKVEEAEVVREFVRQQHPMLFCFGVRFHLAGQDEEKVLRYVRQRELEVLRKGLNG
jgi:c-di-GMP-binding flagellar brake protein YcgR